MSGNIEKTYIKIKDKLKSINLKIIRLEQEISSMKKELRRVNLKEDETENSLLCEKNIENNKNKKKNRAFLGKIIIIPMITMSFLTVFLFTYYDYKNENSTILFTGIPKNIECENFHGELIMNPTYIAIESGNMVNQSYIKVIVDNQEFEVKPGDLKLIFDSRKHIDHYNIPYANFFGTKDKDIFLSTTTNSNNYVDATRLLVTRNSNVTEHDFNVLTSSKNQYEQIKVENFKTKANIEIQDQDTISCEGGIYIYVNGEDIVKNLQSNKDIKLCNMQPGFPIDFSIELSKGTFYFAGNNGISLNGTIKSFSGKTGIDKGKMVFTSLNEQRNYDIGGIDLSGEGNNLSFLYDFSNDDNIISISGKINKLQLNGVNIMDGIRTFVYSNLTSIFSAMIAAILASIMANSFSKNNH